MQHAGKGIGRGEEGPGVRPDRSLQDGMIKGSSGATSWSLSPPVHLQQLLAALSLAEDGNAQHCLGKIRKKETHIIQYTHK